MKQQNQSPSSRIFTIARLMMPERVCAFFSQKPIQFFKQGNRDHEGAHLSLNRGVLLTGTFRLLRGSLLNEIADLFAVIRLFFSLLLYSRFIRNAKIDRHCRLLWLVFYLAKTV